jgi:hypothetical protein
MFIKNKVLFSGITNENGVNLLQTYKLTNTGYVLRRITDGENVGSIYELKSGENEHMFIEVENDVQSLEADTIFMKDNIIIAGVVNELGFELCLSKSKNNETLYTGKKFIRIHDGQEMGNVVYLGNDHSYTGDKVGRVDKPQYYIEVDDICESNEEVVEGVEN